MDAPPIAGVLETAIYVADLDRARAFYEEVLGLSPMFSATRLVAYAVGRFALSVAAADLPAWATRMAAHGVAEAGRTQWPRGGTSLYFRDPDGHLLELATPGIWPNEG